MVCCRAGRLFILGDNANVSFVIFRIYDVIMK
jgi:hypothetical protein